MIRQILIIFGCLAIGELLVYLTGIKIPSSIIGMLVLTLSLKTGLVKLSWVDDIAELLTKNLAFFFIPPGVAIMLYFDLIKLSFWSIVIASFGSAAVVLLVTGWTHQWSRRFLKIRQKGRL